MAVAFLCKSTFRQLSTRQTLLRGLLLDISNPTFGIHPYSNRNMSSVADAFKKHAVVPDVTPDAPTSEIEVAFGGLKVNLGNVLTPTQVQNQPSTLSWATEPNALYTLILTDPDAPSRKDPQFREWHHWLVVNIPGTDVAKGNTLSEYIGSGPPPDTGLHRYVYLVYKQPTGPIDDKEHGHLPGNSGDKRGGWKAHKFAQKHKLQGPVAGNFYQAEFDDYVPKLYAKLSG